MWRSSKWMRSHMWWSVRHYSCIPYRVELYGCIEGLFCQLFFPHFVVSGLFSFILFCRHGQSLFRGMGIKCCFLSLSFTASQMFFFSLSVCFYLFIKLQHVRGNCFTLYIFFFFWLVRGSPFTAWSRSEYSHACYTYCQQFFFSCFYLPGPFNFIFS